MFLIMFRLERKACNFNFINLILLYCFFYPGWIEGFYAFSDKKHEVSIQFVIFSILAPSSAQLKSSHSVTE